MEWSVPPYFEGCGVIIARVHVISVPLARMEFWHMEAPYAKVNRPLLLRPERPAKNIFVGPCH